MSDVTRAHALLDVGRPADAEQLLRNLLIEDPGSAEALRTLAQALLDQDRAREALEPAAAAVAADPDRSASHQMHAVVLCTLNRNREAVPAARKAVSLSPHSWEARTILAATLAELEQQEQVSEALEHANEAVRLAPHEAGVHVVRGICLSRSGRQEEATRSYHEALALEPDNALALNNLAAQDISTGRVTRASLRLTAALSGSPQEEILLRNLDAVLLRVIRWNYIVTLGGGLVLCSIARAQAGVASRSSVLGLVLLVLTLNLYRVIRNFPRRSQRWVAALASRVSGSAQYLLFLSVVAAGLVVIALGVLPTDRAADFASRVTGFFTIGLIAGAFWTIRARIKN